MTQTKKKQGKDNQLELMADDSIKPSDGRQQTTIRLPQVVLDVLDKDADRCVRNRSQQIEALLKALYFGADVNISPDGLQEMAKASSFQPKEPPPETFPNRYIEPDEFVGEDIQEIPKDLR